MKLKTILRNEAGELGDGGGGAGTMTPLQGEGGEGSEGAGDGGEASGGEGEGVPAAAEGNPDSFTGKLFNSSGSLAENWEQTMTENGLEKAIGYLGRESLGGNQDAILKGALNLVPLMGKKIGEFTADDVGMLSEGERSAMLGKLQALPESAEGYDIRGLEQFKDQEISDDFVDYWSKAAHELQIPQEKVAAFFAKNSEWAQQVQESQGKAEQTSTAEQKEAVSSHFKQEWGDDYGKNAALTNTWADQNLDPANPLHVAMLNDKKGLDMVYRLALAEDQGRAEGSFPTGGDDGNKGGSDTYIKQFDDFLAKNHAWTSSTPEIRAEGERLSKLAFAENQRNRR